VQTQLEGLSPEAPTFAIHIQATPSSCETLGKIAFTPHMTPCSLVDCHKPLAEAATSR
jgi:hypothetical protein